MRIALVAQEYPPETAKGGIGTQTFLKAHGLVALGHEMHVISRTPKGQPAVRTERDDHGVHVTRVPGFEGRMGVYTEAADWLTYSAEVAAEIAILHARRPLDLVEFPEWAAEGYVHLLNRTEWNFIPTAVQLHGPLVMFAHAMGWPETNSEFYRAGTSMEGACVRLADAVFSSSACSADWCAKHYGVNREHIPVLHTGVDTGLFSPRPVEKADCPTIVFAGKLVPNKGIISLVEAACVLAREFPNLRVQLLGRSEPTMTAQLQRRAQAAGAPRLLEFVGFVDRSRLPEYFSRGHVFAMPSPYEPGPGLVYLEAMACGLPVIACETAGAAEVVRHEETGLLVPPGDVAALAGALRSLLGDSARRDTMGAAARRFVVAEADSRICIKRLEGFYLALAARRMGAPIPRTNERMIYHVYANQTNVGDWLSARGIQALLAPRPMRECFCDTPFAADTLALLNEAGPEDFIVIGGGGLFMDYFAPFWEGFRTIAGRVPFVIWGAGACDLKLERSRLPVELISDIVRQSRHCVVRDELTRELLSGCEVPPPVICPSVVAVPTTRNETPLLLHVDHYNSVGAENFAHMAATASAFAQRTGRSMRKTNNLISRGHLVQLQSALGLYAAADRILSSRLHGCILALATGRKVLAVSGDHKVEAFMRAAGLSDWVLDLGDIASLAGLLESLPSQQVPFEFIEKGRRENRAVAATVSALLAEHESSFVS